MRLKYSFSVLFLALIAAMFDRRFALLAEREAAALRESEERFRSLYRRTPLPLHSLDWRWPHRARQRRLARSPRLSPRGGEGPALDRIHDGSVCRQAERRSIGRGCLRSAS